MRFLIHWALRREELCDPGLCPDAPDESGRCDNCPLDKLDAAECSAAGSLIRRALDIICALNLGVGISLDSIRADELYAMLKIREQQECRERELRGPTVPSSQ